MNTLISEMIRVIDFKSNLSGLRLEKIHQLDHLGTLQGVIVFRNHSLQIENGWEDCGVCWEHVSCSCGSESNYFSGNGCWQQGHNGPPVEHQFNLLHLAVYEVAKAWEKTPRFRLNDLRKKDKGFASICPRDGSVMEEGFINFEGDYQPGPVPQQYGAGAKCPICGLEAG